MRQLTPKEKRAKELMAKLQSDDLPTRLKDYHHFLDTLLYLNEALIDDEAQIPSWKKLSVTLLFKFAFNGFTLHHIWSGLPLSSNYYKHEVSGVSYTDVPSAKAVLRSKLETFLMYHYIYVNPSEEDTKELRYYSWIYTGLLHRQQFPSRSAFAQRQRAKDIKEIERLKNIILNLPAYKHLSSKRQAALINHGSAKLFSHWSTIMTETGFIKNNTFLLLYTMLSVYAHSEGLSAIQLNSAFGDPSFQAHQSMNDCLHAIELVCMMITALVTNWPAPRARFAELPEQLQWDVEILTRLGKATGERLDKE